MQDRGTNFQIPKKDIDFVLTGGLALSTMGIFRFTKDIDFLSQNIEWVTVVPTKRITTNYKL